MDRRQDASPLAARMTWRDVLGQPRCRPRWACALAIALIVPLGLATRALPWLPGWIREHGGDALWAAMVFWGCAWVFPRWSTRTLASAAALLAAGIECSQLWQHPLLQQARATRFGALVLGHGFLWIDLVRYAVGVALAVLVDAVLAGSAPGLKAWREKDEASG